MKHAIAWGLLLSSFVALPAHASGGGSGNAPAFELLQLNEILAGPARDWDGSGTFSSRDDEWVEVRNAGTSPVDLSAYILTDSDSIPRYRFSGTLAPGERHLVTGRASYDWERGAGFPAFGLSLGNSGDTVMLWLVTGADTVLVDEYAYRAHEAAADRAVGRAGDAGTWTLFDGLNPYTGTLTPGATGCSPTPSLPNECGITSTRSATWGALKGRFR